MSVRRLSRLLTLVLATWYLLALTWAVTPMTAAAQREVTATVTPDRTALSPGRSAAGILTLVNGGTVPVSVEVRPVVADESVQILPPTMAATLASGESQSLAFTVTRVREGTGHDVAVVFVVSSPHSSVVASLTVTAVASPALIAVTLGSNTDRINENRSGSAILIVSNPREAEARVTSVAVTAPASATVVVTCPGGIEVSATDGSTTLEPRCSFGVGARRQVILPVTMTTTDPVVPGARSATFQFLVGEADTGTTTVGTVVTAPFTVEVFGESDILQAVGVPVFLVLPGVIIIVTAWFLIGRLTPWRRSGAGDDAGRGVVGAATGAAIVGVAVSLLIAKVYPVLTKQFVPGYERDYTRAYGFLDFYYVFGYSFLIAVVVWLVALSTYGARLGVRALFVPEPGDQPAALLRKIGLRGLFGGGTTFQHVRVDGRGGVLLRRQSSRETMVAPRIVVTAAAPGGTEKKIIEKMATENQALRLWWALRRPGMRRRFRLHYRGEDIPAVAIVAELAIDQNATEIVQTA